ncbi:MBL fold metallo-hydrolase [Thalassospira australica]|uniref:MBL fold metallo-hydrolase n=1 Tax=Thalassospira australica TaxID=1528106 RepID=UPI00051A7DDF|nr:MBL fold metallo-hydrolase [Thalassospira australica]
MKTIGTASVMCLMLALASTAANAKPLTSQELADKGLKAGENYPGLHNLCDLSSRFRIAGSRPPGNTKKRELSAEEREKRRQGAYVEPTRVFDNLYFVGNRSVSSWAIQTSDGIILVDALNNNDQAERYIEDGLIKLGLNPEDIKYLVITHGHGDHYGGQEYLVNKFHPKVVMSDQDWNMLEDPEQMIQNPRWGKPPKRDVTVNDRGTVSLGDTNVKLFVTPGHTPGTISLIFPVQDGQTRHHVGLWGGTGLNFGPKEDRIREYAQSAEDFEKAAQHHNVDVFLSNHPRRDGSVEKMQNLQSRTPGSTHPFVDGEDALGAFQLLHYCTLAQAERLAERDQ